MKVLMFGWEFPPFNSGGLGVACWGIAHSLAKKGTQVAFVLPKKLDIKADSLKMIYADTEKISFHPINSALTPYVTSQEYVKNRNGVHDLYSDNLIGEVLRYAKRAARIAKKEHHNVIHAHDWLSFPAGVEAKKVSKKPLVAHVHATEFDRSGGNNVNSQVYEIEKEGMIQADRVIAVSNLTKKTIIDKYGIDEQKIQVIHNGINLRDYSIRQHKYNFLKLKESGMNIVLFAGRITLQKGPDYFIYVAKKTLEYLPNTLFLVAGAGDMEYQIIRLTAELGISNKVLFVGYLRGEELNNVYRSADVLVMPSVSEPFGITALEALANNTPILISKQSGASEVVQHALKADFWDVDEMVNKIVVLLKYKSLHSSLRENGNSEVQKLTWDLAADKCLHVYNQLTL